VDSTRRSSSRALLSTQTSPYDTGPINKVVNLQMLQRAIPVPSRLGKWKCPPQVNEFIKSKKYRSAAESLMNANVPFYQAYVFLSNSPEALEAYLKLMCQYYFPEPVRQQVAVNMYLSFSIPLLLAKPAKEYQEAFNEMIEFIKKYKDQIEKNTLYNVIKQCGNDELLRQSYYIFNDKKEYIDMLFELSQFDEIFVEMASLAPQRRAQIFKSFPLHFQKTLLKKWSSSKVPDIESVYPFFTDIVFSEPIDQDAVILLQCVMERMFKKRRLEKQCELHLYYMLLALTNNQAKINDIFANNQFQKMDHDLILRWLFRRKLYQHAGQYCAHLNDRHLLGVDYSLRESLRSALDLLTSSLREAHDIRQCWLRALEKTPTKREEADWRLLLETATVSGVLTLDDIIPLMPHDMPIDSFQGTILRSIKEYQTNNHDSQNKISLLIKRAGEQREVIGKGASLMLELDPLATCWICKQSIFKDKFLAFPCLHCLHIKCFLSHMHLFYDATSRLNIISLAARAIKGSKQLTKLGEEICKSCPVCGELSVNVLDKDFVMKEEIDEREMWRLD